MLNSTNGGRYDIKARGIKDKGDLSDLQYKYRGSVDANGDFGSAVSEATTSIKAQMRGYIQGWQKYKRR